MAAKITIDSATRHVSLDFDQQGETPEAWKAEAKWVSDTLSLLSLVFGLVVSPDTLRTATAALNDSSNRAATAMGANPVPTTIAEKKP